MADDLDRLMARVGKLPTMPHVASKILELVGDPSTSARKLQLVIDSDQVLALRILKVANSALYSLPRKVKTLREAIVMLGFNHIRSLVLAEAIQNLFKGKGKRGDLLESMLWEHSVGAALAAKTVALGTVPELSEEAFVTTLVHDVGKLILLQSDPAGYQEIIEAIYSEYHPFAEFEQKRYGMDHAEVGAALAARWNLHERSVEAIRLHHADTGEDPLTDLLRIGNAIAWKAEWGFRREPELALGSLPCAQRLGLDAARLAEYLTLSRALLDGERQTFGVPELGHSRRDAAPESAELGLSTT
ncbi:HDOD domain-containing protein [bacterium]|nr:HDOD domain-containing protein [bacterium]